MPLLLRSLDLPDLEIRANVIDILLSIALDESSAESASKPSLISEHAATIVAALLRNVTVANAASPVCLCHIKLIANSKIRIPPRSAFAERP